MSHDNEWISLPVFLSLPLLRSSTEKSIFGGRRILLAAVLGFSKMLYEAGAILALVLKDKISVAFPMFGYKDTLEEFQRNFGGNIRRRLEMLLGEPKSFSTFVGETDIHIHDIVIKDFKDLINRKIPVRQALELLVNSWCEGVVFGVQFPELTHKIVRNEYEMDKTVSWDERALMNQLTLLGDPRLSVPTVAQKEEEVRELTRTYAEKYFPNLIDDLGLTKS